MLAEQTIYIFMQFRIGYLHLLLDQHFPDSSKHGDEPLVEVDEQLASGKTCYAWEISSHFITKMKVKESFMSFGPDKACGILMV